MTLSATNISFSYSRRFGLSNATLQAEQGTFTGIVGPNGAGKTTLMKIVSGLLPHSSGKVLLGGEPLAAYSPNRRARHLAYIPQTHAPVFEFTVEQTVLLGRMPYHSAYGSFETDADMEAAERAIVLLELEALRGESITRLSGGELQRVMIAKALAQQTDVLVLDEPTTHLDVAHQQRVLEIIHELTLTEGLTVLASIHDLNLASMYSDSIAIMATGTVAAQGTPEEILTPERIIQIFGISVDVEHGRFGNSPAIQYRSTALHRGHATG